MRNTAVRTLLLSWALVVSQATDLKDGTKAVAFSCRGRSPGYYADLDSGCQDYHMCDAGGRRYTYSCPNQTLFQQRVMICDHWFMVNCSLSETHFGANLLIGQKDRHFVEHFQQASGHNEGRSYPSRSRAYYAGPPPSSSKDERTQPQGANEIKQALFGKHSPVQSVTKKLPEEKDVKTPDNNRYYSQFSTPTGSIKPTTERSLPREFTNNPFFRSLTQASALLPVKGDRGSLTFLSPHQSDGVSISGPARTTASPLPSRRTASSFSTPPVREAAPNLRNTASFPNYHQRRTSTLVTTAVPLTYDYSSVAPEDHSNHLTQTETPKLRNNFSKVNPNYGDFTSEPSLTTRYESLKTRERADLRAPPTPVTPAPHDLGVTPSPQADNIHTLNSTQGGSPQPTSYGSGQYRPNVTQGAGGLQRTSGGFRFTTVNAAQAPDERLTPFSPLVPIIPENTVSVTSRAPSGSDAVSTGSGSVPTGSDGFSIVSGGVPNSSEKSPSGPSVTFYDGVGVPTAPGATVSDGGFPSGPSETLSGNGVVSTGLGATLVSGKEDLLTAFDAIPPSSPGEHEDDYNTVEVRIPDPRRMFFIPDSAAREAEMLSSNNETVFKISLPSTRPHGAMRFKGLRGAEGRRADCPQCHPAFLLPGKCQPCVLIRR